MQSRQQLFEKLYKEYGPKIQRLCMGYTADAELANDLLQESFLKVWQHLETFRAEAAYGTWIYRIAVNTCLAYLRSPKNAAVVALPAGMGELAEEKNYKEQQVQQLYKCVSKLPETERLIIGMVLEEMPYADIAAVTGISEGNLRVKIHRAKQQLATLYNQQYS